MEGFQPRIEDPPASSPPRDKWAALRKFVTDAAGRWCLVGELTGAKKKDRNSLRAKLWSALKRRPGYQCTGIELHAVNQNGVYKVYARYIAENVVKNPEPQTQPLTQEPGSDAR